MTDKVLKYMGSEVSTSEFLFCFLANKAYKSHMGFLYQGFKI